MSRPPREPPLSPTERADALARREPVGAPQPPPPEAASHPRIGVALGSGGARGLAHIPLLEAFDELGLRPAAVAGSSMGAVVGGAYCAGLPARALRAHAIEALRDRGRVMTTLIEARVGRFVDMFNGLGNPLLLDAEHVLCAFWPSRLPDRVEELAIPFQAVATDFFGRSEVVYREGPLVAAVAGSMAIPGLFKPVQEGHRLLIDGGAVNPLPFDLLVDRVDVVVAVDVAAGPEPDRDRPPGGLDVSLGAIQIMQESIVKAKLKLRSPDVVLRPPVTRFRVLDFLEAREILAAAEPTKDELKRRIEAAVEAARRIPPADEAAPGELPPA